MADITLKNALAIQVEAEDLKGTVENLLKSKHWPSKIKDFSPSLAYIPYYVFHYTAFREESNGEKMESDEDEENSTPSKKGKGGDKVVSDINHGTFALEASSGELEAEMGDSFDEAELEEMQHSTKNMEVETQKPKFSLTEATRLATLKTAKELGIPKENVEISSLRLVYFPIWRVSVSLPDGDFELDFSGVDGEMLSEDEIPEREKGKTEIAGETFNELSDPKKWVEYLGAILNDFYNSPHLRGVGKFFLHDNRGRILLVAILLVMILIFTGIIRL